MKIVCRLYFASWDSDRLAGGLLSEEIKFCRGGSSCFHSKPFENPLKVFFNGARANSKNFSDVYVALAGGEPLQDFDFALGQPMSLYTRQIHGTGSFIHKQPQTSVAFDEAHEERGATSPYYHF